MPERPLDWIAAELFELEHAGLRRHRRLRTGAQGPVIRIQDESGRARELINFASNDYLSLAAAPQVCHAASRAIEREGFGAGASPLIVGFSTAHAELERRLAELLGTEAALVFPSGFAANCGAVAALVGRGDLILADEKNHASLIDGCRLSRAEVQIYPHGNVAELERMLQAGGHYRRRLIVSDTLFSMDGDLAPLEQLVSLAERYGAMLLVDEAHAVGVFGPSGGGLADQLGLADRIDIRVGTLSKALGSSGGFVAGSRPVIDWLLNRARPYVFSTAHPAALASAAIASLDVVEREPDRRRDLLSRAADLRLRLNAQGWSTAASESQIIPLIVGEPEATMQLSAKLQQLGLLIPGIRPPSVPHGQSLLRISLAYGHTPAMIDQLVSTLTKLRTSP